MIDGDNTQQAQGSQCGNDQIAEIEQHVTHLLPAKRELLADYHRCQLYLAVCDAELPVAELQSSQCEPGCERMVIYYQKWWTTQRVNAEAALSPEVYPR